MCLCVYNLIPSRYIMLLLYAMMPVEGCVHWESPGIGFFFPSLRLVVTTTVKHTNISG